MPASFASFSKAVSLSHARKACKQMIHLAFWERRRAVQAAVMEAPLKTETNIMFGQKRISTLVPLSH
jgi:hypothetical protein